MLSSGIDIVEVDYSTERSITSLNFKLVVLHLNLGTGSSVTGNHLLKKWALDLQVIDQHDLLTKGAEHQLSGDFLFPVNLHIHGVLALIQLAINEHISVRGSTGLDELYRFASIVKKYDDLDERVVIFDLLLQVVPFITLSHRDENVVLRVFIHNYVHANILLLASFTVFNSLMGPSPKS